VRRRSRIRYDAILHGLTAKRRIQQRGSGAYSICIQRNNLTGVSTCPS
jgi:hypothetical protein